MTDPDSFDETALTRLQEMVGADVMKEVVELYREHTPQRIEAAREGLRSGVLEHVARAMHTLKSSAAMIGASRVETLASRLEQLATQGRSETLAPQLDELETAAARVESYLRARE